MSRMQQLRKSMPAPGRCQSKQEDIDRKEPDSLTRRSMRIGLSNPRHTSPLTKERTTRRMDAPADRMRVDAGSACKQGRQSPGSAPPSGKGLRRFSVRGGGEENREGRRPPPGLPPEPACPSPGGEGHTASLETGSPSNSGGRRRPWTRRPPSSFSCQRTKAARRASRQTFRGSHRTFPASRQTFRESRRTFRASRRTFRESHRTFPASRRAQ